MSIRHIHRATLQTWLTEGSLGQGPELALLDLRDEADFAKGHPLFATNVPLRRLAREVAAFIPRRGVRTVLVDGGDGRAEEGADLLETLGYPQVHVLKGGIPAWLADGVNGLPTFDIPGIVFSESVRDANGTPSIAAIQLNELYRADADVIVLDTRTPEEFEKFHVPGARNLPGAEILHRFLDHVPSPDTLVVVSCAGLPRAILGAQTLIDAGVPNRVVLLEDGTSGWTRAGLELEKGAVNDLAPPSARTAAYGRELAARLAAKAGVTPIGDAELADWRADGERTSYLLDTRLAPDHAAGHLEGAVSAPGGQLLAVSHRTVAVRGARLVLADDGQGTRANTTAYWLKRRGWDVRVHAGVPTVDPVGAQRRVLEPAQ